MTWEMLFTSSLQEKTSKAWLILKPKEVSDVEKKDKVKIGYIDLIQENMSVYFYKFGIEGFSA